MEESLVYRPKSVSQMIGRFCRDSPGRKRSPLWGFRGSQEGSAVGFHGPTGLLRGSARQKKLRTSGLANWKDVEQSTIGISWFTSSIEV